MFTTYPDLVFFASGFFVKSLGVKPYYFIAMHLSTALLISNM